LLPNLTSIDWLIILLYLFSAIAIGLTYRSSIKTSSNFLQTVRTLPTWICALAFIAASLGSQEIIAFGAAGARYGLRAALFFSLGAIPAMIFAALYMMPIYYGSAARTVPEYLRLRFDPKTGVLNACTFSVSSISSAGISLYVVARLFQTLHVFDPLFYANGWPLQGIFTFSVLLPAAVVLAYVLFAGLAGAMVNQVVQFFLMVASFLPVVLIGLKNIGGWGGLKASLSAPGLLEQNAPHHAGAIGTAAICFSFGLLVTAGRWTTDFRILQAAMAAKNIESARRIPLFSAAVRLLLPLLLILPGAIAIGLPTPHSTTIVRNENGAIYHEITVVPPEAAAGRGLVPARIDTATGKPQLDAAGNTLLNYDRSTPNMLMHFLPTGLLGLGMAALLASLMGGLASSVTAFNSVIICDIYQSCFRKAAGDKHYLAVARWAAVTAILLSIGVAYALNGFSNIGSHGIEFNNVLYPLLLVFSIVSAPQFATFLLGMFTKRATGHGAFAGLIAGTAAALLHHGLTLPIDSNPGINGGWIAVAHRYPGFIAQCFATAILGFAANIIIAFAVSLCTQAKPEPELMNLVYLLSTRPGDSTQPRWKRPETIGAVILLAGVVLGIFLV
jgi:solute:Na+ symporter, SSS family